MAATRSSIGNEYEDFEPNFQWKEDESSNFLVLHLPEFEKEQMKITYVHSSGVIRVTGEKPISKHKWRRFNKAFPVPHNCNVQKIQAKFQAPNLTITLPKATPSIPSSKQDLNDTKKQEIPKQPQISRPSEKKNEEKSLAKDDEKERKEQVEAKPALLEKEAKNDKKREESFSKEEEFANKKLKKENEALAKPLIDDTKGQVPKKEDKALTKPLVDEAKDHLPKNEDKSALKCDEKASRVMAFGREMSEDKQSLVNIGVAILVIAALGAYVSYTYASSSHSNN